MSCNSPPGRIPIDVTRAGAVVFAMLLLSGCSHNESSHFDDPVFQKIADLQDKRLSDSLYRFFKSKNPSYRAAAAISFASIEDTAAAPFLGNLLLQDTDTAVQINSAFALGQISSIASVDALIPALQDKNAAVVREVLHALGKTVKPADIHYLKEFNPVDPKTEEGLSWAYFRVGARGLADSIITEKQIIFLGLGHALNTRIGAANFFARAPLRTRSYDSALVRSSLSDPSAAVRMLAASGLGRLGTKTSLQAISRILKSETDFRVRINATRSLSKFDPDETTTLLLSALNDSVVNVGIAASEVIGNVVKHSSPQMIEAARGAKNWRIQANLYQALARIDSSGAYSDEIKMIFNHTSNKYQKAWLLAALAMDSKQREFILGVLLATKVPVIRTSAAEGLMSISYNKRFSPGLKPAMAEIYKKAIAGGDPAVVGIISTVLADSTLDYKDQYKDIFFLYEAKSKMKMPKDIESLQIIENALATLEKKKALPLLKNEWNHPIDWKKVRKVSRNSKVLVETSRGNILLRLLVDEAPGSVSNFLSLVSANYFDGKIFHRTVPNFVIQTGCNRGDGYGSEDYSIRSEFSRRKYAAGSVGMASAGKDTEGTQWFITNSATSNLDGRYTIFAIVEQGMNVVDRIEVGDRIIHTSIE